MSSLIPEMGQWSIDPEHLRRLRLKHAEEMLAKGDFDRSLVEVEELLTNKPDDGGALWVSARAALGIGDACMAEAALLALVEQEGASVAPLAQVWSALSSARFLQADFAGARDAARTATEHDPHFAQAWVELGLAAERLFDHETAEQAATTAERLAPGLAPRRGDPLSEAAWNGILQAASAQLDDPARVFVAQLEVIWEWFPNAELLRSVLPPVSPLVDALISADPAPAMPEQPTEDLTLPLEELVARRLIVYRGNLLRGRPSTTDVVDRLAAAIHAEVHAWLMGMVDSEGNAQGD